MGGDGAVGIATFFVLDGPGVESLRGRDFPHMSMPALGPIHLTIEWVLGLFRGLKQPGLGFDTHFHLVLRLKKD